MIFTFLSAHTALAKSFRVSGGMLEKSPYPNVSNFTSIEYTVSSLEELCPVLIEEAAAGHCLLKGNIQQPLYNESRAGSTTPQDTTLYVCQDLDGLKDGATVESYMDSVGLGDVSYIVQYSASMGVDINRGLSAHVFCTLSGAVAAPFLKQWLIGLNLNTPSLRDQLALNRVGAALRYPLDITTCQNDKILYIAPPIIAKGVPSTFTGDRITYVRKELASIPTSRITPNPQKNRIGVKELINELRKLDGYPVVRDNHYKVAGSVSYMSKPGEACITSTKSERGFVYFNLNGGDSWAYYHPENQPDYIFNFKGEPAYKTEELLPEYYLSLVQRSTPTEVHSREYFAIRDFATDKFYNGYYDADTNELVIAKAQTETRLRSFLKQHGQPIPDFVPDWHLEYNPASLVKYDAEERKINLFQPSEYEGLPARAVATPPPIIKRVIEHAVGTGPVYTHFMNWLAFIVQYKTMTETAWILHGIQGTGKGIIFSKILSPILGRQNCHSTLATALEGQFNSYAERTLLLFIDECQMSNSAKSAELNAKMKNAITEPYISLRRMGIDAIMSKNHQNVLYASNQPDPVIIELTDRRNNVGQFQPKRLEISEEDVNYIAVENEDFFHYLKGYAVDSKAARTVLQTDDRARLIQINQTSVDEVAEALLTGNLEYLLDQLPSSEDPIFNTVQACAYRSLIELIFEESEVGLDRLYGFNISRDELFIVYDYCVGNTPRSPNKFTSMLKHHRVHTRKVRRGVDTFYGISIVWKHDAAWFVEHSAKHCRAKPGQKVVPITKQRKT